MEQAAGKLPAPPSHLVSLGARGSGTRVSLSEPKVDPRRKLDVAERVFRVAGVLILVVAGIHLLATPLFGRFMAEAVGSEAWKAVGPPSLLSFIVLGILLFPVGAGAFTVAPALRERWAWRLAWVIALSFATLPVCLLVLMRGGMYRAPAFIVAEVLVTIVGLTLPGVLAWVEIGKHTSELQ